MKFGYPDGCGASLRAPIQKLPGRAPGRRAGVPTRIMMCVLALCLMGCCCGCGNVKIEAPCGLGEIQATTFDLLGTSNFSISTPAGTVSASTGGPTALFNALLSVAMKAQGGTNGLGGIPLPILALAMRSGVSPQQLAAMAVPPPPVDVCSELIAKAK